jgi:tetratricopeptide (TPR) repeat protein
LTEVSASTNIDMDQRSRAESLYKNRDDPQKALEAIESYRKIVSENPRDEKAACRLAQLLVWHGALSPDEKAIACYKEAAEVTEKVVKQNPQSTGGHYWLGVAYGLWASTAGPIKSLSLVGRIKEVMEKLAKLDPSYEGGGAYRVLGRLYNKLPFFLGGDDEKAEELLRKAMAEGPRYWLNHLYLADLLQKCGREKEARQLVTKVRDTKTAAPGLEPETRLWKDLAGKYLRGEADPDDSLVKSGCAATKPGDGQ